jgi:hypothetical protein
MHLKAPFSNLGAVISQSMVRAIREITKSRGRPRTTGVGEPLLVRLHEPLLSKIDDWAELQPDRPTRPEAIRRLVAQALETKD